MIKVTYEYDCDACGKEIREKETFAVFSLNSIPTPSPMFLVGTSVCCDSCLRLAENILFLNPDSVFNLRKKAINE